MKLIEIIKEKDIEFKAENFELGDKITIETKITPPIIYYDTYIIEIKDETNRKYWKHINSTKFIWP